MKPKNEVRDLLKVVAFSMLIGISLKELKTSGRRGF